MIEALHILSVGPAALDCAIRDAVRYLPECRISTTAGLRELFVAPRSDLVDIAILDSTLSPLDLEDAGRLIRRQWPGARILILRAESESPDDALYDERMQPGASPGALLAAIQRFAGRGPEEFTA